MAARSTIAQSLARMKWEVGMIATLAAATFFRFWDIASVAPGLSQDEASLAVRALALSQHPSLSVFAETRTLGSSLFISLEAITVKLLGSTILGVRIVPALLGIAAVWFLYLWLSSWFSRRIGLMAAMLYAVSPWVITASRRADLHGLVLLMVPLVAWAFTRAFQTGSLWRYGIAGILLGLSLTNDLGSAMLLVITILVGGHLLIRRREFVQHTKAGITVSLIALVAVLGITVLAHLGNPSQIVASVTPDLAIAKQTPAHWVTSATKSLIMFNVHGDDNFSNNVGGAPLLNFFVGLMFVMGILVAASRFHRARYGALLALFVVLLIPALLSPYAPDARAALVIAPIVIALSAVGINYLLDIWYSTFPVNSAARSLGTLPIILLLLITLYQGYKQYFVAWAGSPEVYQVHNEPANAIGTYLNRTTFDGQRYVAVDSYSRDVLDYVTHGKSTYNAINIDDVGKIATDDQAKQIIITNQVPDTTVKSLKDRFPKARLSQHYSEFNDNNELFAVYEVLK